MKVDTPGRTQLAREDGLTVEFSHEVDVPIEVTDGCESLTVRDHQVPWLAAALHRAGGYRPDRVLIVYGTLELSEIMEFPGARDMVACSDLVVAVAPSGRSSVVKSKVPDSVEVGVLRVR